MQETRNNCFGSKIRSTTLRQAKAGKHECGSRAYLLKVLFSDTYVVYRSPVLDYKILNVKYSNANSLLRIHGGKLMWRNVSELTMNKGKYKLKIKKLISGFVLKNQIILFQY